MSIKTEILGVWRNSKIEYVFNEKNHLNIVWKKSNISTNGEYFIDNDIITFKYGYEKKVWKGKIKSISSTKLIISDISNEFGEEEPLYRIYPIKDIPSNKISLSKYILERFSLVFLVILNFEWLSNLPKQIQNFFGFYTGSFLNYLFIGIFGFIIIALFILSITSSFVIIDKGFENILLKINKKEVKNYFVKIPEKFIKIIIDIIEYEMGPENNYTVPFFIFFIISFFIINGSPIINNYKGVYASFEQPYSGANGSPDGNKTVEIPSYVYDKNDENLIDKKIKKTANEIIKTEDDGYEDYEDSQYENLEFNVSSRGYLFEQTAIIEGFKSNDNRYKGFADYISCLIFFTIEKLLITIIWFLIPFLTWIGIAIYRRKT